VVPSLLTLLLYHGITGRSAAKMAALASKRSVKLIKHRSYCRQRINGVAA